MGWLVGSSLTLLVIATEIGLIRDLLDSFVDPRSRLRLVDLDDDN